MPQTPKKPERERCIICREWNLPKDMYTPFVCVYCIKEGRVVPKKQK